MDALINALDKLITKKRLAGFSGEWETKKLGDICEPSISRINPLTSNKSYKCIELEHLSQETGRLMGYEESHNLKSQKTIFKKMMYFLEN